MSGRGGWPCGLRSQKELTRPQSKLLVQSGDDYGHVIGLLGSAGPFFGSGHEGLGDNLWGGAL